MSEMKAYVSRDNIGRVWVCCPYCGKRNLLVTKGTKIKYLPYKCKNSRCSEIFLIENIGYTPCKRKEIQGQMKISDFL